MQVSLLAGDAIWADTAMVKLKRATRAIAAVSLLAALMVLAWPVLTLTDKPLSEKDYTEAMNEKLRHRDRFLLVLRWVEPVKPQLQKVKYDPNNLPGVEPAKPREVTYDYSSVPGMIVEWPAEQARAAPKAQGGTAPEGN